MFLIDNKKTGMSPPLARICNLAKRSHEAKPNNLAKRSHEAKPGNLFQH